MASGRRSDVLKHLQALFQDGVAGASSDAQLLEQFAARPGDGDDVAFRALVERHGPMVWRVCRGVLGDSHDADDAFQATFLVLARRAGSIRSRTSMGSWLHGVAHRVALKAKTAAARRRVHETRGAQATVASDRVGDLDDFAPALHQEIDRLPAKYRVPIVLCYLEGRTQESVANDLGWPIGTVRGRLARARDLLRLRLIRRGLVLHAGLMALGLDAEAAPTAPSFSRLEANLARVARIPMGGVSSETAALLAKVVLRDMVLARSALVATALAATALFGTGAALVSRPGKAGRPARAAVPLARQGDEVTPRPLPVDAQGDPPPQGAVARLGTTRFQHGNTVRRVAYAPGGAALVSLGSDGVARLWDAATGRERGPFGSGGSRALEVAFAPDGKSVAVLEDLGRVLVCDPATRRELRRFEVDDPGQAMALSSDGKVLAVAGRPGRPITLRDYGTGRVLGRVVGHRGGTRSLTLSPDGRVLVSTGVDSPEGNHPAPRADLSGGGSIRVWDASTGGEIRRIPQEGGTDVVQVVFSPDGRAFAAGQGDGTIRLRDAASGEELSRFSAGAEGVGSLAFAPGGKVLAWGSSPAVGDLLESRIRLGAIHLCDLATGREVRRWEAHAGSLSSLAFSADGKTLASSGAETVVRLWDVSTGRELRPGAGHPSKIGGIAFTPDGNAVVTGGQDGTVRFWDPTTGTEVRRFEMRADPVSFVALSADGKVLAAGGQFGPTRLWEVTTGRELGQFRAGREFVSSGALSPDGSVLATGGETIRWWNTATGIERPPLGPPPGRRPLMKDIQFTPGGALLAGTDGAAVFLWDAATGAGPRRIGVTGGPAPDDGFPFDMVAEARFAFSRDARTLASASNREEAIVLLRVASGKEFARFAGGGRYKALAFSPDGRLLASGHSANEAGRPGLGGEIRLWDVAEAREVGRAEAHRDLVSSLAFSPDGTLLASAGEDSAALIWDVSALIRRGPALPARPPSSGRSSAPLRPAGGAGTPDVGHTSGN